MYFSKFGCHSIVDTTLYPSPNQSIFFFKEDQNTCLVNTWKTESVKNGIW